MQHWAQGTELEDERTQRILLEMYAGTDYANNDNDRRRNKLYKHRNYRLILIRAKGTYNKNYNTDVIEDIYCKLLYSGEDSISW
jgi:hypothetical protein